MAGEGAALKTFIKGLQTQITKGALAPNKISRAKALISKVARGRAR